MPQALQEEFLALIQQHEAILHKVIGLYLDDAAERADARQEILLQAWRSYPSFKRQAKFSTWLYRVALNTVLTIRRKARSATVSLDQAAPVQQMAFLSEEAELLWLYIRQLPEIDRAILSLHFEGYRYEEIGEILVLKENTVATRVHRIKKKLQQQHQHHLTSTTKNKNI